MYYCYFTLNSYSKDRQHYNDYIRLYNLNVTQIKIMFLLYSLFISMHVYYSEL